jgi:hypothetical protein
MVDISDRPATPRASREILDSISLGDCVSQSSGRGKGRIAMDRGRAASWRADGLCWGSPLAIVSSVNAILCVMTGWLTVSNPVER